MPPRSSTGGQDVDADAPLLNDTIDPNVALLRDSDLWRKLTSKEQQRLRYETLSWNLSQFLHGSNWPCLWPDNWPPPCPGWMPSSMPPPR